MSLTSPAATDFDARCDAAVRLLCEGHGESFIAASLGMRLPEVRRVLKAAVRASREEREEAIDRHREQLRWLWRRVVKPFTDAEVEYDAKGKEILKQMPPATVRTLLAIQEREAKLLGLDAPTKQEVKHEFDGLSTEELARQAATLGIDTTALLSLPQPQPFGGFDADAEAAAESDATS